MDIGEREGGGPVPSDQAVCMADQSVAWSGPR